MSCTESRISHINLFTADRRYILQSISQEEKKYFLEYMIEHYHKRVIKNSLIQHIYGIFKLIIRGQVFRYIILENPLHSLKDPVVINVEWNHIYSDAYSIDSSNLTQLLRYLENTLGIEVHLDSHEFENLSRALIADLDYINRMKLQNFSVTLAYSKFCEEDGSTTKIIGTIGEEKSVIVVSLSNLIRNFPKMENGTSFGSLNVDQQQNIMTL